MTRPKPYSYTKILKLFVPFLLGLVLGVSWNNIVSKTYDSTSQSEIFSLIESFTSNERNIYDVYEDHDDKAHSISFANHHLIDGWKPIYVYYGEAKGIKSSKPPMFQAQNSDEGSQVNQDVIIDSLMTAFQNSLGLASSESKERGFFFLDLAANDATALSNTYKLEQKGWNGLCVEPNPVYWFRLAHRKCMVAGTFVGGADLEEVEVSLKTNEFGGIVGENFDNNEKTLQELESKFSEKEKRYTISISTMFQQFNVPKSIDYLSLDVEGAEELIMNKFPFDTYIIRFLTVERPKLNLVKLLEEKNYRFVMMLVFWGETLWVHESVLDTIDMGEIKKIVTQNKVPARRIKKGQQYFDIKTGKYATMS